MGFCKCRIIEYCIKKRLLWNSCFARKVCKEAEYYEDMMRYLKKNLAVNTLSFLLFFVIANLCSVPKPY